MDDYKVTLKGEVTKEVTMTVQAIKHVKAMALFLRENALRNCPNTNPEAGPNMDPNANTMCRVRKTTENMPSYPKQTRR
jgi:hypothetical protein